MSRERLFFETLKVDRGSYFVQYSPPITSSPFATVQLIFSNAVSPVDAATAMEREVIEWLQRYPVPIMVSAFDASGSLISLEDLRGGNHAIGWNSQNSRNPELHWRMVADDELPHRTWEPSVLRSIYADIPSRTSTQLTAVAQRQKHIVQFGWWLVLVWAVVIPTLIAIIDFNAPEWLARLTLLYSLSRAYIEFMKLKGWWPRTDKDLADADEERRMRHHHYHCERNPQGFERLRSENFERESRDEIQREAASLKAERHDKVG